MKYYWCDGLVEDWGGLLGLIDGFTHVDREPWCSRAPRRALIAAIIRWAATRTGMVGGLAWTGVGLHTLHARPLCTAPGCCEGYRSSGHGGPHVSGGPSLTVLQTAFSHRSRT